MTNNQAELIERFHRYVAVPSQSLSNGGTQIPSSEGQWNLAKLLKQECAKLGLVDVHLSDQCVLTGKLPANLPNSCSRKIP